MKKIFRFLMILVPCMALASCSDADEPNEQNIDNAFEAINLTTASRSAASQLENFYIDFAKDAFLLSDSMLSEEDTRHNMVVSPLSATFALGMLANGTDADTQSKLTGYLGVEDMESLNELSSILLSKLPTMDSKSELSFSNALWAAENLSIKDDFASSLQSSFNASVQYLNFVKPEIALGNISNWIASATNNRITSFLPELAPSTCLVIANAFYFQSQWAGEYFDKDDTTEECFHGLNVDASDESLSAIVNMMHSSSIIASYANDGRFEYVALPFGNGAYTVSFLLPNEDLEYDKAIEILDKSLYDNLVSDATDSHIRINVPRLEISGTVNVHGLLKAKGINMSEAGLSILEEERKDDQMSVIQGANFSMDESGASVAATTIVYRYATAAAIDEIHNINLNHPFLFFITEKSTNACLLAGRVVQF